MFSKVILSTLLGSVEDNGCKSSVTPSPYVSEAIAKPIFTDPPAFTCSVEAGKNKLPSSNVLGSLTGPSIICGDFKVLYTSISATSKNVESTVRNFTLSPVFTDWSGK